MSKLVMTGCSVDGGPPINARSDGGRTVIGNSRIIIGGVEVKCPKCGSSEVSVNGLHVSSGDVVSRGRAECRDCGYAEGGEIER